MIYETQRVHNKKSNSQKYKTAELTIKKYDA